MRVLRNDNRYVQARIAPEEKERFLKMAKQCGLTAKTTLFKKLHGEELRELPPEGLWNVSNQIGRMHVGLNLISSRGSASIQMHKLWRHYFAFDQYVQSVRCAMIYIALMGIDADAEYPYTNNKEKER